MTAKKRPKVKVFLVDDHPIVRDGVRAFLSATAAIEVVGEASAGGEALLKIPKCVPDVVVMDVNMPGMDGGELAKRLRAAAPGLRLVAFSMHAGEEYVARMARCGARGYVLKDEPTSHLVTAIMRVFEGGLSFPKGRRAASKPKDSSAALRRLE